MNYVAKSGTYLLDTLYNVSIKVVLPLGKVYLEKNKKPNNYN